MITLYFGLGITVLVLWFTFRLYKEDYKDFFKF